MTHNEAFDQGARCGHIEGKERVGAYNLGEEWLYSFSAADAQKLEDAVLHHLWAQGYRYGYRRGAEGNDLDLSQFKQ